jgi:hypothetical protein
MVTAFKAYMKRLGILSLSIFLITTGLFTTLWKEHFIWAFPCIVLYFYILNALQHFSMLRSSASNPRVFHTNFMMWFSVKLFLNLTIVLVYILADKAHAIGFVGFFGGCYVIYTIFEVASLFKILRS